MSFMKVVRGPVAAAPAFSRSRREMGMTFLVMVELS